MILVLLCNAFWVFPCWWNRCRVTDHAQAVMIRMESTDHKCGKVRPVTLISIVDFVLSLVRSQGKRGSDLEWLPCHFLLISFRSELRSMTLIRSSSRRHFVRRRQSFSITKTIFCQILWNLMKIFVYEDGNREWGPGSGALLLNPLMIFNPYCCQTTNFSVFLQYLDCKETIFVVFPSPWQQNH